MKANMWFVRRQQSSVIFGGRLGIFSGGSKMKKLFIAGLVSFALSSFSFASEEIQLAAAIGAGASTTAPGPVADTSAAGTGATGTEAGSAASSAAAMSTGSMVAIGALAAGAIAALASSGGGSSTSNH